ncbi:MAG: S9 family peptidase [Anaerolineales bacterium]
MKPTINKEDRHGWPAQARPDRKMPEPWSLELLISVNHIHHHNLSPDGKFIAFIWQREGNSDVWLIKTVGQGWPQRLTFDRPQQASWTDDQPRWSPDGNWIVYAAHDDIWAVPRAGGKARKLTDFKHGDEHPVFSADGERIFFLSGRKDFLNLCWTNLESEWPSPLTSFNADISDPQPAPDGQIAFVYKPQDDLNRSEICLVSDKGGKIRHLTGASKVMDLHPRLSPDNRQLAFISNRTGWQELYLMQLDSGEITQLTSGQSDVHEFAWSHAGKRIALVVNKQGSNRLDLLDLDTAEQHTLHGEVGWHTFPQWGPDDSWLSVEFESSIQAPDIYHISVESGEIRQLTFSQPPALAQAKLVQPEFVQIPSSGGVTISGLLFRPQKTSATEPCAAIVYPHGGPTDQHGHYWEILPQWLAAKGYAVLAPNYRGSTGSGLDHQFALHNNWGIVDTQDMLAAADYLASLDWVDGDRLGIYGSSYGSYLAVLALARDPLLRFKCGVAKFGDCDILSSWAQGDRPGREDLERQMGHPTKNRPGYKSGSPIYDVENIASPLLILHGDQDARVHPKQSEQLVEALKKEGKTFEYVVYEGEGHGFLKHANVLHFYSVLERFLDWYLL